MQRLLSAISLILLLADYAPAGDIGAAVVDVLTRTGTSWDGKELPGYPKGRPEITILRIKIPPGAHLPVHTHPVINAGVLLTGELTVVTEASRVLHLKAGDSLVEVVNTWHYGKNEGDLTAEIIVFYAGTAGSPVTIMDSPNGEGNRPGATGPDQ